MVLGNQILFLSQRKAHLAGVKKPEGRFLNEIRNN
jgi:hypothetical protein